MNKTSITLAILCLCTVITAQNLVPNPSFEIERGELQKVKRYNFYPYEFRSGNHLFQHTLANWFSANSGTPDLRVLDANYKKACLLKHDKCDRARTGTNTLGLLTYMENNHTPSNREYIQIKLKEPLQPGKTTHVELWIRNDRWTQLVSNNIGFYFSMNKIFANIITPIKVKPHYNHDQLIRRDDEWVQIKGSFVPDKAFSYVTIGNFFGNEETQVEDVLNYQGPKYYTVPIAYYQIDDVAVYQGAAPKQPPAPKPPTIVQTFKEKPITVGTTIELKNVEFDTNSDHLKSTSYQELSELINWLQSSPTVKIGIHGYTDDVGSDTDNLQLSVNRAKRIYEYLVNNGIEDQRLDSKGFGESRPIAENSTEEGRKRNRRVEFVVISK